MAGDIADCSPQAPGRLASIATSASGQSTRIVGRSQGAGGVLAVIVVTDEGRQGMGRFGMAREPQGSGLLLRRGVAGMSTIADLIAFGSEGRQASEDLATPLPSGVPGDPRSPSRRGRRSRRATTRCRACTSTTRMSSTSPRR